jgi:hypothetical protein
MERTLLLCYPKRPFFGSLLDALCTKKLGYSRGREWTPASKPSVTLHRDVPIRDDWTCRAVSVPEVPARRLGWQERIS